MDRNELELLSKEYDDASLWRKVRQFARKAGREVVEKVLILYFCLKDPETPQWARRVIMGALAYFVLPLDVIPDIVPFAGFSDDMVVLIGAITMVVSHIKDEHHDQARERLLQWFGSDESGSHAGV